MLETSHAIALQTFLEEIPRILTFEHIVHYLNTDPKCEEEYGIVLKEIYKGIDKTWIANEIHHLWASIDILMNNTVLKTQLRVIKDIE